MKRLLGCAAVLAVALAPVFAQPPEDPPERPEPFVQEVLAWVDRALGTSAGEPGSRSLRHDVEAAVAGNNNVSIFLDRGFTGGTASLMAITWAGGIHGFELTDKQAREAGLAPNGGYIVKSDASENSLRTVTPIIRLERLEAKGGASVSGSAEIECTAVCKVSERPTTGTPTLRVRVSQGRTSKVSYTFLPAYPDDGAFAFTIQPVNGDGEEVRFGPTVVAADLLVALTDGRSAIISNTAAFLLDVRPDLDAFARLGLQMMDEAVALLAGVEDTATATATFDAFQRFSTRNKALVEAMARLQPTPEQDRDIEAKYGAKMDAVGRKLAEQVTRLEATDYGKAFLDRAESAGGEQR
jgi:hypothetical protein